MELLEALKTLPILTLLYYAACSLLWLLLAVLFTASRRQAFPEWLASHPRIMLALLGVDRLPKDSLRILRKFYLYLSGGWTWILAWSWFLGPMAKSYFFRSVVSTKSYEIARLSTLIVIAAYAAAGFYAIGKAISIWFKTIYLDLPGRQPSGKNKVMASKP